MSECDWRGYRSRISVNSLVIWSIQQSRTITSQRQNCLALARANNPCAEGDDPVLLVAYMGERRIGHIGLVPGLLRTRDRFSEPYWGSTLFVAIEFRITGGGIFLTKNLLSTKADSLEGEMSKMVEKVWTRQGRKILRTSLQGR